MFTLPKTNSSPLKLMDGRQAFPFGIPSCQVLLLLVSGSVKIWSHPSFFPTILIHLAQALQALRELQMFVRRGKNQRRREAVHFDAQLLHPPKFNMKPENNGFQKEHGNP